MTKLIEPATMADSNTHAPTKVSAADALKLSPKPFPQSSAKRRRIWLLRGLTLIMGLVFALGIAEIGLRLFVVQEGKRMATYDSILGWRGLPHGQGVYSRKSDNIEVDFQYNELGFRDRSVTPKNADTKRLMLLGDSFVESLEVDYNHTFGAQLEQALKSRDANWDVCVIGSQGYSTAQELLAFQMFQPIVDADLVLLCFYCGNDFEDNLRQRFAYLDEHEQLVLPANTDPAWKHASRRFQRWLYESSHVVFLLKNSAESFYSIQLAPESKLRLDRNDQYQRSITQKLLQRLQREVTDAGGQLGVVVIPSRDDLLAHNSGKVEFIIRWCENQQVPCVDLSRSLNAEHYFGVDLHFNELGHQVTAQAIDGFIANGMLPSTDLRRLPNWTEPR